MKARFTYSKVNFYYIQGIDLVNIPDMLSDRFDGYKKLSLTLPILNPLRTSSIRINLNYSDTNRFINFIEILHNNGRAYYHVVNTIAISENVVEFILTIDPYNTLRSFVSPSQLNIVGVAKREMPRINKPFTSNAVETFTPNAPLVTEFIPFDSERYSTLHIVASTVDLKTVGQITSGTMLDAPNVPLSPTTKITNVINTTDIDVTKPNIGYYDYSNKIIQTAINYLNKWGLIQSIVGSFQIPADSVSIKDIDKQGFIKSIRGTSKNSQKIPIEYTDNYRPYNQKVWQFYNTVTLTNTSSGAMASYEPDTLFGYGTTNNKFIRFSDITPDGGLYARPYKYFKDNINLDNFTFGLVQSKGWVNSAILSTPSWGLAEIRKNNAIARAYGTNVVEPEMYKAQFKILQEENNQTRTNIANALLDSNSQITHDRQVLNIEGGKASRIMADVVPDITIGGKPLTVGGGPISPHINGSKLGGMSLSRGTNDGTKEYHLKSFDRMQDAKRTLYNNMTMNAQDLANASMGHLSTMERLQAGLMAVTYGEAIEQRDFLIQGAKATYAEAVVQSPLVLYPQNTTLDVMTGNRYIITRTHLNDYDLERFDHFLATFGWGTNQYLPEVVSNLGVGDDWTNFNYVEIDIIQFISVELLKAPGELLELYRACARTGFRLWHRPPTYDAYKTNRQNGRSRKNGNKKRLHTRKK